MSKSNGLRSTIIENRVFYEKHADLFDPLDKATYENLKEAIAVAGHIISAIVVDEEGNIIDGIHRLRIANELHLRLDQINLQVVSGLTDEQRIEKAYELNLHRRQLSKEKQQAARLFRIKRIVKKRQEKKSSRVIASELGVSQTQVLRDIEDAEALGLLPTKVKEEAQKLHTPGVQGCTPGLDNGTGQPELHTPGETPVSSCPVHMYETPVSSCPVHMYETPVSSCPVQASGAQGYVPRLKTRQRSKTSRSKESSKETQKCVTDAQPAPLSASSVPSSVSGRDLSDSDLSDSDLSDSDIIAYLQQLPGDKRRRLLLQVTKHIVEFRSDMERVLQCC